jgi:hypothetical protein
MPVIKILILCDSTYIRYLLDNFIKTKIGAGNVVEYLPSIGKVLGSSPAPEKRKKKKGRREGGKM